MVSPPTKKRKLMASPSPPTSLSLSCPPPRNWDHNVFPSFHGPDVRKAFLSHMLKELRNKGIEPFIDNNDIDRSKSIGPELDQAIKGSKIAIVLLSKNYTSSSWCLDELVNIMKCREVLGQTVVTIFYEVDPTDVKKQTGDFGKAFEKTCSQDKTKEKIETWRKALEGVATIAGYHSKNWDSEAAMIEDITTDISKMLNHLTPSCDFERYIGMGTHIEKMRSLLRMDSDEVRMIGIWGPPGIGKSTIARFLFKKLSSSFQLRANVNMKEGYPRPCPNEYRAQLQLQKQMLSQMLNLKDMEITHLRVAPERLKDKKVLLVVDDVDQVAQLVALAEDIHWFGRGSRIIITTQDVRVLRAHGIDYIYTVDFPSDDEALQIFCMSAFGQKYPKDGFRELAWQIVCHAGKLPLGLTVMGSYFRNMSKKEWRKALPKLWRSLDGKIESILKFSFDALDDDDQNLFLHIACFFKYERIDRVTEYLAKRFPCVSQGLNVLYEKSLISFQQGKVKMHDLLQKFGEEIGRKQSAHEPGKRQFLIDNEETYDVLNDDGTGSENVIGIKFSGIFGSELNISERAFKRMSNLQFLWIEGYELRLPHSLSYLSSKLRLLCWDWFPMTCLLSNVNMKFLVELNMRRSKLEKLWVGIQRLPNLKWMNLRYSENLKEIPDLSTATKLQELNLNGCSSLVELPSSIGNLHELKYLTMKGCSKLEVLPINVNLKSLDELDLSDCSSLKSFPEISTNIRELDLRGTAIEEVSSPTRSWPRLQKLDMSHCKNLKKFAHALDSRDTKVQEVSPLVHGFPSLFRLILKGCKALSSLTQLSDSLSEVDAENCESLERLECSFRNPNIRLNFSNCFILNKEARDLIVQTSNLGVMVLPGKEIPTYFSHRANGGSLIVKLNERPFPSSLKFKACILLVGKNVVEDNDEEERSLKVPFDSKVSCSIMDKQSRVCDKHHCWIGYPLTQHLYIYKCKADNVTSDELLFEFTVEPHDCKIKKCGILEVNEGDSSDEEEEYDSDTVDEEEENGPNGGRYIGDYY